MKCEGGVKFVYLQVLRLDLTRAIQMKRPRVTMNEIVLHQDNAHTHMAEATWMGKGLLGYQLIDHPPIHQI